MEAEHRQGGDGVPRDCAGTPTCDVGGWSHLVVWPQARVLQRTVELIVETFVPTPCLGLPMTQGVDGIDRILHRTLNSVACCPPCPADGRAVDRSTHGVAVGLRSCAAGGWWWKCRISCLTQCFLQHLSRGLGFLRGQGPRFVEQNIKVIKVFSHGWVRQRFAVQNILVIKVFSLG